MAESHGVRDLDFIPTAAAVMERSPRGARLLLWAVAAFVVFFVLWAGGAQIEEVVKGQGRVIPSTQIQVVQNLEGGIVRELLVKEGDVVRKGQVLLHIDDTRFGASLRESKARLLALKAKAARLLALSQSQPTALQLPPEVTEEFPEVGEQETKLYQQALDSLAGETRILEQQLSQKRKSAEESRARIQQLRGALALASKELKLSRPLLKHGAISEIELLRMERETNDLRGELQQARSALRRAQSEITEAEQKIAQRDTEFRQQARERYAEVLAELKALEQTEIALSDRVSRTAVRSPLDGTVKHLAVNTVGGVVQPGMDLVEIVPIDDSLMIEAKVAPRDIAFLRPDLPAVIKLTAYDFAIYGGMDARLEQISADTFIDEISGEPYYQIRVRTLSNLIDETRRHLKIIPGMTAEVDIVTGKKTILDYLLKPILRARDNALRER